MALIFRLDANDLPSCRRRLESSANAPPSRALGDKLQLLALLHAESLRVIEAIVDDTLDRLNKST